MLELNLFFLYVGMVLAFAILVGVTFLQDIEGKIDCKGNATCFEGNITKVVDGDTIDINGIRIRLSLVDTPEVGQPNYSEAKNLAIQLCPIESNALVDQDDGQKGGSYGRMIGEVYCKYNPSSLNITKSLNAEMIKSGYARILTNLCNRSEFENETWATTYGCQAIVMGK